MTIYIVFLHRCLIGISNLTCKTEFFIFFSNLLLPHISPSWEKQTNKQIPHSSVFLVQNLATNFDSCLFFTPCVHSINKSCRPYSYTSPCRGATFTCYLLCCNSLFLYLPVSILALLPSPLSKVILLKLKLDHITTLWSQDSPMSSHFLQSKIRNTCMVYKALLILPYLTTDSPRHAPCFLCCSHTGLLAVPQTDQAHSHL